MLTFLSLLQGSVSLGLVGSLVEGLSPPCTVPNTAALCPTVAINLIVQHIQDILNGGLSKRQTNGYLNGYIPSRKRQPSESSSRPH